MSKAADIKNKIKEYLEDLITDNILAEVLVDDFKENIIFDKDIEAFPAAILSSPSIESETFTNSDNQRKYTFEIMVVMKAGDIEEKTDVETLMEEILDKFDDDVTMAGVADGGVEPSATPAQPVYTGSKGFIVFSVIIKAKAVIAT